MNVGNRTQRVDQQGTHTYAYDLYRLTSVTYPGPSTTTYAFDAFGNRTSMTVGAAQTTYTYDDADRVTSVLSPQSSVLTYTWDDNGSLTNRGSDTFAWDYEERMTSATVSGTTTTFAYRGDGLRDSRTTGGSTTTFSWDIAAGLPVVIDDGAKYVYGAGLEAMVAGGSRYYYLADGLGSTMAVVDATGAVQKSYTYDVYGEPTATGTLPNEFDFAGQQTDATGLQYLRARYMDPETGVFLSREPLAMLTRWPRGHFGYAGGNPPRMTDPTGLVLVDGNDGGNPYWNHCPPDFPDCNYPSDDASSATTAAPVCQYHTCNPGQALAVPLPCDTGDCSNEGALQSAFEAPGDCLDEPVCSYAVAVSLSLVGGPVGEVPVAIARANTAASIAWSGISTVCQNTRFCMPTREGGARQPWWEEIIGEKRG